MSSNEQHKWDEYASSLEARKGSMMDYLIFCPLKYFNPKRLFNIDKGPKVPMPDTRPALPRINNYLINKQTNENRN